MPEAKTMSIWVDAGVKARAERIFSELGIPTSTAINMFLRSVVRHGGFPMELRIRPNRETEEAIEEIEQGIGLSRVFNTPDELMEDLMSDA